VGALLIVVVGVVTGGKVPVDVPPLPLLPDGVCVRAKKNTAAMIAIIITTATTIIFLFIAVFILL
jgi:hypothetical protein